MRTLVIEKQAVKKNAAAVKEKAGSAAIYAVLAGDARGAGLTEMAKLLRDEGIGRFAVSEPSEVQELREAGFVDEEILMLRSTTDREELERLIDLKAVCTIGSYDTGVALNALAEARATVAEAHLQVDTGLGFGGFLSEEPDKILSMYRYLPNVALSGIYTQIHGRRRGERTARAQVEEFDRVVKLVREAGFETGLVHAAGSYALMHYGFAVLDGVRVGSAFLGRGLRQKDDGLTKVGYGEAALCDLRWLPKGHTVGNEVPVVLKKPTRVAVLPVGYQNGYGASWQRDDGPVSAVLRWWSDRHRTVRIGGQLVRVIGCIGAMETVVDVTDVKCTTGDIVAFDIDPMYCRGLGREYR